MKHQLIKLNNEFWFLVKKKKKKHQKEKIYIFKIGEEILTCKSMKKHY